MFGRDADMEVKCMSAACRPTSSAPAVRATGCSAKLDPVGWLAERLGAPLAAMTCALCGFASVAASWPLWRACVVQAPDT